MYCVQDFERGRIRALQEERLYIQKKTFTKWMNSFLHKAKMEVEDLFTDLADGRKLLKLLEIISGNTQFKTRVTPSLLSCREFNCCDDTIAWRKSTKEAQRPKIFVVI